jgi:hypothetical protein
MVTIAGSGAPSLEFSHDNGFCSSDVAVSCPPLSAATLNVDFEDNGPADHGAGFQFNLGPLPAGATLSFRIYYGAAPSEAQALEDLGDIQAEVYSLGQQKFSYDLGLPFTFMFAFVGIGGEPLIKPDADGDGVPDDTDNCVSVINPDQLDSDGDGIGNACESDTDLDGVPDDTDNCVSVINPDQLDSDGDGIGNACETDTDGDGVVDDTDNCVSISNPDQLDSDGDGIGNACELDFDGDGVVDDTDNCITVINPDQLDSDGDGIGNACELDSDLDGVPNDNDNCVLVINPDQLDSDGDGIGNACELDSDSDGVIDDTDNCVSVSNPDQLDSDGDGIGNECEQPSPRCTGAIASKSLITAPFNHKFENSISVQGVLPGTVGDTVTIEVISVTQDEVVCCGSGSGNTSPDAIIIESNSVSVRRERNGDIDSNGRFYIINFQATDQNDNYCMGYVSVTVAHDNSWRKTWIDNGQFYDSTEVFA